MGQANKNGPQSLAVAHSQKSESRSHASRPLQPDPWLPKELRSSRDPAAFNHCVEHRFGKATTAPGPAPCCSQTPPRLRGKLRPLPPKDGAKVGGSQHTAVTQLSRSLDSPWPRPACSQPIRTAPVPLPSLPTPKKALGGEEGSQPLTARETTPQAWSPRPRPLQPVAPPAATAAKQAPPPRTSRDAGTAGANQPVRDTVGWT